MQTTLEETALIQKTKELCQTILEQPEFQTIRRRLDTFSTNDEAQNLFQSLNEKGEFLNHRQQQGVTLTSDEIADYEKDRETFLKNPVATGFLDAQREMQKIQESVGQYVSKTFELGRVPEPEDFQGGSCGAGCGCH